MPHVSVIVPTCNREDTIEKCLVAVRESTYQDYELIVVDDGSQDATRSIAKEYADKVIEFHRNLDRSHARNSGTRAVNGEIVVNIDSDIVIKPDTLTKISKFLSQHQDIDALTGLLSKECPHSDFFSRYKNLYMHYIFKRLPEKITFLYGSIYALRCQAAQPCDCDIKFGEDTALGQKLFSSGKKIAFLKNLEVIHLKRYDLFSFVKNDFRIPFHWAKIFLKYKGWRQLGRNKTGFAHASKAQLLSVILAPTILVLSFVALFGYVSILVISPLILVWFFLNFSFLVFLGKERGPFFGIRAFFVTLLDNIVMASGILCGFAAFVITDVKKL